MKTDDNFLVVDGPSWLTELEKRLRKLNLTANEIRMLREPKDAEKWKSMDLLVKTVPAESKSCNYKLDDHRLERKMYTHQKECPNATAKLLPGEWIDKGKQYFATAVLSVLSGGLVWLASNTF
jgi:hypothetical protein